jgi:two-component system phosphate regulon sensor histidine kinase PhoR
MFKNFLNTGNPENLSWVFTLITCFLLIINCLLFYFIDLSLVIWIVILISEIICIYFLFKKLIVRFIYDKIRLIYKNIATKRLGDDKQPIQEWVKGDVLNRVQQDVERWIELKNVEIATLKELENFRKDFLANVSHELKTPITTLQGYVDTLIDGAVADPDVNMKYLQRSSFTIERMITMVEDLETITKLEQNTDPLHITKFDFIALVKEVIDIMELKANTRNIQMIIQNHTSVPVYVLADKDKIREVLINLIDNSIKYGRQSGKTFIKIYYFEQNLLIEVEDNGIGIDEEHLQRIFERFYRVDKSRSREVGGTGLGLAIVKHIIEAHDQHINVRSKVGVGTTFTFSLPLVN